jgi:hypothetical protein
MTNDDYGTRTPELTAKEDAKNAKKRAGIKANESQR